MTRRTAILGVLAICFTGFGYRAFGYKLTIGNFLGVKINRMVLVDHQTNTAFDSSGNALSMKDPLVDNGNTHCGFFPETNRQLNVEVSGAKEMRIRYGDGNWQVGSQIEGKTVFPFPINHGNGSISYEIQAATDDWHQVDSWDGQSNDRNYRVSRSWNLTDICVKGLKSYTSNENLSEFRLEVDTSPTTKSNSTEDSSGIFDDRISFFFNGKKETIRKVKLFERSFHTVLSGSLAFGANPNYGEIQSPDHSIKLASLCKRDPNNIAKLIQWDTSGRPINTEIADDNHFSYGGERGRHVTLKAIAGETSNEASITVAKSSQFSLAGWSRESNFDAQHQEYNLELLADPNVKVVDLTVGIASDPFKEIA